MEKTIVKTQKAEIPSFDGWEFIGFVIPKDNLPCSYPVNSPDLDLYLHEADDTDYLAQICYRRVAPERIVLERISKDRLPRKGDIYMDSQGQIQTARSVVNCRSKIYRVVEEQS